MKQLSASEERLLKNAVILAAQSFVFQALTKQYGIGIQLFKLCSKIGSGSTPKGGKAVYVSDGIPFVRSMNVRQYKFQEENLVRIPPEINEAMSGTCVVPGDVYLNITGASIGRSCCAPEKLCPANVSQHVCIIRPITELLDSCFLMYWLNDSATQEEINTIQKGATRQALTKRQIENFRVPGVPLSEQKEVAAFLESVRLGQDYREIKLPFHLQHIAPAIARIEELAAKVEEARGLRRQSVEYGLPSLRNGIFRKAFQGKFLDYSTNEFHKDELSSIGKWVRLGDICSLITDGTDQTPTYTEKGMMLLSAQNIKPYRFMPENHKYVSYEDYLAYTARNKVQKGDILITRVGAGIGEVAMVDQDIDFAIYVSLGHIRAIQDFVYTPYLVHWLNSPAGVAQSREKILGKGHSQGNLNLNLIRQFLVPLPPLPEQHRIVAYLDNLQAKVDALKRLQAETAAELDALLPSILDKAFKGEL